MKFSAKFEKTALSLLGVRLDIAAQEKSLICSVVNYGIVLLKYTQYTSNITTKILENAQKLTFFSSI